MYDYGRDTAEAIVEDYNPIMETIPKDSHGFHKGTFKVLITWSPEGGIEE